MILFPMTQGSVKPPSGQFSAASLCPISPYRVFNNIADPRISTKGSRGEDRYVDCGPFMFHRGGLNFPSSSPDSSGSGTAETVRKTPDLQGRLPSALNAILPSVYRPEIR